MVSKKLLVLEKNCFLDDLESNLQKELQEILSREEILWFQNPRASWIMDGDRNTKYYHTKTFIRRRRNKIMALRNEMGDWMMDQEVLKNHAKIHFNQMFTEDIGSKVFCYPMLSSPPIDQNIIVNMVELCTDTD